MPQEVRALIVADAGDAHAVRKHVGRSLDLHRAVRVAVSKTVDGLTVHEHIRRA